MGKTKMNFIIEKDNQQLTLNNITPMLSDLKLEAEKFFSVAPGSYKVSYLDIDNDPIAVEDDDDLAVCILEFSEMSKIDEPVHLILESVDKSIPRRRDTPKGSGKSSPRSLAPILPLDIPKKDSSEWVKSEIICDDSKSVAQSNLTLDDAASQLSEKVMDMVSSKIPTTIEQSLDSKLEALINSKVQEKLNAALEVQKAELEAKKTNELAARANKKAEKLAKLKDEKEKKQKAEALVRMRAHEAKLAKEERRKERKILKQA